MTEGHSQYSLLKQAYGLNLSSLSMTFGHKSGLDLSAGSTMSRCVQDDANRGLALRNIRKHFSMGYIRRQVKIDKMQRMFEH